MGNVLESLVSGFTKVLADLLAKPLDFLSGKACTTACGPMWDIVCYVDNFCVANTAATLFLLYLVLLFFYVVYKLGICGCLCHGISKLLCSCLSCSCSACKHGCTHLCNKMRSIRRARRRHPRRRRPRHQDDDVEQGHFSSSSSDIDSPEDTTTTTTRHRHAVVARHGDSERSPVSRRRVYLERSLRPRNHRVTVGVSRRSDIIIKEGKEPRPVNHRHDGSDRELHHHHHGIKVTHTSRFARKGSGKITKSRP